MPDNPVHPPVRPRTVSEEWDNIPTLPELPIPSADLVRLPREITTGRTYEKRRNPEEEPDTSVVDLGIETDDKR